MSTNDIAARYGVNETNNIADAAYNHTSVDYDYHGWLGDPELVRIDRIRLLTDPGCPWFDISYCYGTLRDGRHVRVDLGTHQLLRRKGYSIKRQLVELAQQAGAYAKGLGMLDEDVLSILW